MEAEGEKRETRFSSSLTRCIIDYSFGDFQAGEMQQIKQTTHFTNCVV